MNAIYDSIPKSIFLGSPDDMGMGHKRKFPTTARDWDEWMQQQERRLKELPLIGVDVFF